MKNAKLFLTLAVLGAISPLMQRAAAMQATPAPVPQSAASMSQEETLYTNGTKAMDEQRWADAVTAFDQVAAAKSKHSDAAIYWKAYSLDKLGRKDEAQSVCDSLRQQQPSSSWNKECVVLRVRGSALSERQMEELERQQERLKERVIRPAAPDGQIIVKVGPNGERIYNSSHPATEDDIKILALNSLMQQDPAKALPLLHNLILSDAPIEVRKQGLFVLSRSKQPEAQAMLMDIVTSSKDPALQLQAIQALSIYRPKDAGPTLVKVYQSTSDPKVKRAVLNGLFIAHDATRLVDLARGEKDLNMKRDIVSQLAIMHDPVATAYMEELLK